jgi:transposase InsO family protein
VRFAFVHGHRQRFEVNRMCRILNVSRNGYYAWRHRQRRGPSPRQARRAELTAKIRAVHQASRGTYGSPRVAVELKAAGESTCENTVAKYMRAAHVCARPRRRFVPRTTDGDHPHPVAPNVLDRAFAADGPDRKWAADLTYVRTDEGWLYLSVVIDLFSRRVVGWSMTEDVRADGVADALRMALARRTPAAGLLHHSDRGSQYACPLYREILDERAVVASMSRPGNCYDNAVVESFFGTLKGELGAGRRLAFGTRAEARAALFEWIECWYNRRRRHSSLGYLSPEQFEARHN